MALSASNRLIFIALAVVLLTTRIHHFGLLPDVSWAVLFLGGFYLRSAYAFAALMLEAVAIDHLATRHLGVGSYCMSPAYAMLVPAYAALWLGGTWAKKRRNSGQRASLMESSFILVTAVSLCFLISNGSFCWLNGRIGSPSLAAWDVNLREWYGRYLAVACAYVGLGALAHIGISWLRPTIPTGASRTPYRGSAK